jgi:hypothetical protein
MAEKWLEDIFTNISLGWGWGCWEGASDLEIFSMFLTRTSAAYTYHGQGGCGCLWCWSLKVGQDPAETQMRHSKWYPLSPQTTSSALMRPCPDSQVRLSLFYMSRTCQTWPPIDPRMWTHPSKSLSDAHWYHCHVPPPNWMDVFSAKYPETL